MALVVMKFGGTSVADSGLIKNAARRIIEKKKKGNRVVVVVSAPGVMTDDLIARANGITSMPDDREMDMLLATGEQISIALLSMAIKDMGYDAISLTGPMAGIHADSSYTTAKITAVRPVKILNELKRGKIVIVAGFQGINPHDDITTLGRGGSDLTAVALAAATKADVCEIYTDVDGVYTADPRICSEAGKLAKISYDEMLEAAGLGAAVMQARSVQVAKKFNVRIEVRSSTRRIRGTIIYKEEGGRKMEEVVISSVPCDKNQVKFTVRDVPDRPGMAAKLFDVLAKKNINVDMIVQSSAGQKRNDISFTIKKADFRKTKTVLAHVIGSIKAGEYTYDENIAKVSIVGVGMKSHPGVAAKMFNVLSGKKINIDMIATSEIKISCVIAKKHVNAAVCALHRAFMKNRG